MMPAPTRLSRLADGLMEACELAGLVLTPLFFNVYSSRIFEPDKAALLRPLALILSAAWTTKLIDQRHRRAPAGGPYAAPIDRRRIGSKEPRVKVFVLCRRTSARA